MLLCLLIEAVVMLVTQAGDAIIWHDASGDGPLSTWVVFIVELVLLVPTVTIGVRRLHDENLNGWWILLPLAFLLAFMVIGAVSISDPNRIMVAGLLVSLLMGATYLASQIVLFVLPANPRGSRFDDSRTGSEMTRMTDPQPPRTMGSASLSDHPATWWHELTFPVKVRLFAAVIWLASLLAFHPESVLDAITALVLLAVITLLPRYPHITIAGKPCAQPQRQLNGKRLF